MARSRAATIVEPLLYSTKQARYLLAEERFNIVPAGRRSGKTAIGKRRVRKKAFSYQGPPGVRVIAGAPTHAQAKRIYWADLKQLFPPQWRLPGRQGISESELSIALLNGVIVQVVGLDEPARIEGPPIWHILLDEFGNMKPTVWTDHLRPTLTDTQGSADFIGAPEGRNHYWDLWLAAKGDNEWGRHTWWTESVLPLYLGDEVARREIESARRSMDRITYAQEYRARFVAYEGLAYYNWNAELHANEQLPYNPNQPLLVCFDFNTAPGVAVICQELPYLGVNPYCAARVLMVIGEVYIPRNSNTPMVCRKILDDWSDHPGEVQIHGDSTGGSKKTSSTEGSDYDIIDGYFKPVFGDRLVNCVVTNPPERARVNSMNSRLRSIDGRVHLLVDPVKCPRLIRDFESTFVVEGGSGEIDKDRDGKKWSHSTDALGYLVHQRYPIDGDRSGFILQSSY